MGVEKGTRVRGGNGRIETGMKRIEKLKDLERREMISSSTVSWYLVSPLDLLFCYSMADTEESQHMRISLYGYFCTCFGDGK